MNRKKNNWLFALMLLLPMLAFFAGYLFNYNHNYIPTGLIMEDNALYLSYAKQYEDGGNAGLLYSNPFNESGDYPNIYFQVQNLLLALFLKLGWGGFSMIVFVILFSLFCFRLIIAIYDELVPQSKYRVLGITIFAWGGGLLALAGMPLHFFLPPDGQDFFDRIFYLDPGWGWWGLNLGRSLFITCEAFYHCLFLLSILMVLKKKWRWALFSILLVSLSHPFTGIELLSILAAWLFVEKVIMKNRDIPWFFALGTGLILVFHVYYYLYYLNQFPDHKSVSDQFSVNWRLRFFSMIPAYALVAPLAFIGIFIFDKPRRFFSSSPTNRLFLCWLIVVLLLVNHELFMKPRQPIHFTRGYDWTAFFLLGLPAIEPGIDYLKRSRAGKFIFIVLICLFLSDNFLWIINYIRFTDKTKAVMYISQEQKEQLKQIEKNSDNKTLLVTGDVDMAMLATVYTKSYPWISNRYTTPFYDDKKKMFDNFLRSGEPVSPWLGRRCIFLLRKSDSLESAAAARFSKEALLSETSLYKTFILPGPQIRD